MRVSFPNARPADHIGLVFLLHMSAGHWCTASTQVACGENKWSNRSRSHDPQDCTQCPSSSTTDGVTNASSPDQCICDRNHYNFIATAPGVEPHCRRCGVGVACPMRGTMRSDLTVLPGYWRHADSLDIRRCPDASANCSSEAVCEHSTSGCRGGSDTRAYCAEGLTGPFVRACNSNMASINYTSN